MEEYVTQPTIDEAFKRMIERHTDREKLTIVNEKLENFQKTLQELLFDAKLLKNCEDLAHVTIKSPIIATQSVLADKYGDPPNEDMITDEDINAIIQAQIERAKWPDKTSVIDLDYGTAIREVRKLAEEIDAIISRLLRYIPAKDYPERFVAHNINNESASDT